ncbi:MULTISPECIES: 50S ribosomal protein L23 [Arenibacter]|uniref:50S ribosomal protein L23 n=1 Tax=Arenibacter TaxID=178469 RepID=UPI000A38ABEF|nr:MULTISPECIES: 50S ribosomal protein L23 [Arenibacter]
MSVLIKPIITEKMTAESELNNRYGFLVDPRVNKIQIKEAVEATYGVSVEKVRTMNYGPSRKSRYTKTGVQHGKTNAYKKAIVDLAEGDIIDFYSNL